jgi:hypothetical protein
MHVSLDIHLGYARDRQLRLRADGDAHRAAKTNALRARIARDLPRAQTRSETALALRRARELRAQHG